MIAIDDMDRRIRDSGGDAPDVLTSRAGARNVPRSCEIPGSETNAYMDCLVEGPKGPEDRPTPGRDATTPEDTTRQGGREDKRMRLLRDFVASTLSGGRFVSLLAA